MMTKAACLVSVILAFTSCHGDSSDLEVEEFDGDQSSADEAILGATDVDEGAVPVGVENYVARLRAALVADAGADGGR